MTLRKQVVRLMMIGGWKGVRYLPRSLQTLFGQAAVRALRQQLMDTYENYLAAQVRVGLFFAGLPPLVVVGSQSIFGHP